MKSKASLVQLLTSKENNSKKKNTNIDTHADSQGTERRTDGQTDGQTKRSSSIVSVVKQPRRGNGERRGAARRRRPTDTRRWSFAEGEGNCQQCHRVFLDDEFLKRASERSSEQLARTLRKRTERSHQRGRPGGCTTRRQRCLRPSVRPSNRSPSSCVMSKSFFPCCLFDGDDGGR